MQMYFHPEEKEMQVINTSFPKTSYNLLCNNNFSNSLVCNNATTLSQGCDNFDLNSLYGMPEIWLVVSYQLSYTILLYYVGTCTC